MTVEIIHGDCIEVMRQFDENSFHACCTDPPYHLVSMLRSEATENPLTPYGRTGRGFMGKTWDGGDIAFRPETWAAVWRVLKPGAHLLAFGGTRTYHRLVSAIEDAGFEIRDTIMWLYGSGFPKSLDVSKAIDRARDDYEDICRVALWLRPHVERAGFDVVTKHFGFKDQTMARARWTSKSQPQVPTWEQWLQLKTLCGFSDEMDSEVWRLNGRKGQPGENWKVIDTIEAGCATGTVYGDFAQRIEINDPTDAAREWQGWGTALKPACEPIVVARKPLSESTVAANVLRHGTGALNIDASRVATGESTRRSNHAEMGYHDGNLADEYETGSANGRWPANVVLSYPDDEYELRHDITTEQRKELFRWFHENA